MILVKDNNGKIHQTTDGTNAIIPSLNVAQEVLWTNPNPGQQFAAQSVNLTDNPFNYDYIAVYYQNGYLREGKYYKGYEVKTFKPLQNFLGVIDTLVLNEEQLVSRQIYNFTENSVTFSDCMNKGYTWNDWLSPMKIIGIKFLDTLNYSTEEQYTGKHWIDGKKIYQKTFIMDITQMNVESTQDFDCSNVDIVINTSKNDNFYIPQTYPFDGLRWYINRKSNKIAAISQNYSEFLGNCNITIQYTKTTE